MKTLKIAKREFPFEVTDALKELCEKTHIKLEQIGTAKNETRRFAFLAARAASEKAGIEFGYTFESFINLVDPEVNEKAAALAKELTAPEAKKKATPKKNAPAKGRKADSTKKAAEAPAIKQESTEDSGQQPTDTK